MFSSFVIFPLILASIQIIESGNNVVPCSYPVSVCGYPNYYRKCPDYYWRDYDGEIPGDAVVGGRDADGVPIYIGLIYIKGFELLPGTIYPRLKIATTSAYGQVFHTGKNVKILCSPYVNDGFLWLSIRSEQLKSIQVNNFLIPGGSEVGESLFISKNRRDNSDIIGKIFRDDRVNRGAWFPYKNTHANELIYDVLVFDCNRIPRLSNTTTIP